MSDAPTEKCGAVGKMRSVPITVVCQLPKGHTGKHGGMGCEWTEHFCVKDESLSDSSATKETP